MAKLGQAAGGAFHRDHVGGRVEEFVARVDDDGAGPVRIAVGAPVSTMAEVHHSYEQAVDTLNHMQQNGSTEVYWFETIRTEQTDYYYPLELEGRFMAAIRAGDRVRVERILAAVRDENFAPERGSLENLRHLLFELSGTLRKLRRQLAWDGCLPDGTFHVDSVDTAAHSFSSQARAALELCGFAEQRKKSHNGQMAGRVAAYIEANYADPQMCLAAVAREFRLSEAYVSGFFKEQHGENFSDYLERLRLSHANRLLSESFMPIREIAVRVGYGSDKAFRRAFKRVHGISPHAYREIPRRMAQSGASR